LFKHDHHVSCAYTGDVLTFFLHADGNKGCRIAPLPLTPENWEMPEWAAPYINFSPSNDTAIMKMVGVAGPRIASKELSTYGVYSVRFWASGQVGVVSAFYVSTSHACRGVFHNSVSVTPGSHMPSCCSRL
jgi:hypothetical protein